MMLKWGELNSSHMLLGEPWKAAAIQQRGKGELTQPSLHLGHRNTKMEKAVHLVGCEESWCYSRGDGA